MVDEIKRDIQSLWTGKCTVFEYRNEKNRYGITESENIKVFENLPCRLSYKNIAQAEQTETVAKTVQVVKLFLDNEIQVAPGSVFEVSQNGIVRRYRHSGVAAVYSRHQEIIVELEQEKT